MDGNTNMARSGKHNGMVTMKPWCLNLNRPWHSSSSEIKTQEGRHCLLPRATQHLPCQVLLQTLKDPLVITLQVSQQCQAHLPETHIPQNRQGLQPFAQQQKKKKKKAKTSHLRTEHRLSNTTATFLTQQPWVRWQGSFYLPALAFSQLQMLQWP